MGVNEIEIVENCKKIQYGICIMGRLKTMSAKLIWEFKKAHKRHESLMLIVHNIKNNVQKHIPLPPKL